MKKIFSFLLLIFYVGSISGAAFNIHFCGGKLQHISFMGSGHHGCCCGLKKMNSNCCKDKVVIIKCSSDHKRIEATCTPVSVPKNIASVTPYFLISNYFSSTIFLANNFHSPPIREGETDLLILNSIFRI